MRRIVSIIGNGVFPKTTLPYASLVAFYSDGRTIFDFWYRFRKGFFNRPPSA
jgi:hypothetical protein